jgi:hypothetical protein
MAIRIHSGFFILYTDTYLWEERSLDIGASL